MKCLLTVLFLLVVFLGWGCNNSQSIVGKWKYTKDYNAQSGKWEDVTTGARIEFGENGKLVFYGGGDSGRIEQSYTSDTRTDPPRFIWISGTNKRYGIYKFEGKKMILKFYHYPETAFPSDVGIEPTNKGYSLSELERE